MIVLDTHAWIWWVNRSPELSAAARKRLETEDRVGVCTISCFEVATLIRRGRLQLAHPVAQWVETALSAQGLITLPLTHPIAVEAGALALHGDPADRIIAATAIHHGATLVTKDDRLRKSGLLEIIW